MEAIESALKCVECKAILESPVFLPCSDLICKKHVKPDAKEFHCLHCDIIHPIPDAGFPHNKGLAIMLEAKVQKVKCIPEYSNAFSSFKLLGKVIDDMSLLQKDPFYLINKKIGELKSETDIIRDQFKLKIDQKADSIIKELDVYEQECKRNLDSKETTQKLEKLTANIDAIKSEMEKWQKTLNCFETSAEEWTIVREKTD
jgi:hypothetical protein